MTPSPSPEAVAAKAAWRLHGQCPLNLVTELVSAVSGLPPPYFVRPHTGEVFDSPKEALRRLNGFALTQGYAVVRDGGFESSKHRYLNFKCIRHGAEARNTRKLKEHVRRNSEGDIVSDRK